MHRCGARFGFSAAAAHDWSPVRCYSLSITPVASRSR